MRTIHKMAGYLLPAILLFIVLFIIWNNYTPGTYLIGWDSLHPEFNFQIAFTRIVNGVWRTDQGMGAVAIHSHMADWPRVALLWLESFVLPVSFLRYSYIFLCLILGPIGVYFFLLYVFKKPIGAFLGALFYLLNLVTLQIFYVPYEMFTAQYAFLPWLFLFALKFLREGKKRNLIIFALLTIVSSPQAYAATLFYAYFGALVIFVIINAKSFKKILLILAVTLGLNSYWLLPNIYSVVTQSVVVMNSNINRLFSPEAYLANLNYANISNVAINRSFLFSWRSFDFSQGKFDDLLGVWSNYLQTPWVLPLLYAFVSVAIFGVLIAIFKKNRTGVSILAVGLYVLFFLLMPKIDIPVLNEALRMPFTKFSILFLFVLAYFFGSVFSYPKKIPAVIFLTIISAGLIYLSWPMFTGHLINPSLERQLPNEYIQVFNWFNSHAEGRVAEMPMNTLWGWSYRNWGYEGSGFLSFGINDPLLDRDFDRWSPYNQDFYTQVSDALYNQDPEDFVKVLQLYNVKYLLMDRSVINPSGNLYQPNFVSPDIKQAAKFGYLTIYEVASGMTRSDLVSGPTWVKTDQPVTTEKFAPDQGFIQGQNCDLKKLGTAVKEKRFTGNFYGAYNGGVSCDYFYYPDLKYDQGYLLHIQGENITGRSLKIYLQNYVTSRMDVEELLPTGKFDSYFQVLPKKITSDMGMNLNVETRAFGRIASENLITKIEFIPVDFIQNQETPVTQNIITNNQAYEAGWIAISNYNILPHIKVNGWENGWIVDKLQITNDKLQIIFWPQLLEWGGMAVGAVTILAILLTKPKREL